MIASSLIDPLGRRITYLRLSVTDRCDYRCVYCMAEHMTFLPKAELLTLEELDRLASAFVDRGVTKIRLTGGEPLVRKGVMTLVDGLALLSEVERSLGLELPDHDYDTLGGYLFGRLGRRPVVGDVVEVGDRQLEVDEMDGLRVSRVRVRDAKTPEEATA